MDSYGTGMPQRNLLQIIQPLCSDIFFSLDMMHPEAPIQCAFLPCYSDLYWQESFSGAIIERKHINADCVIFLTNLIFILPEAVGSF